MKIDEINKRFPIIKYLPKNCSCTVCTTTKNLIRNEVGEKEFYIICKVFNIT